MKATICHSFRFEAAHQLRNVPLGHKCANMHGHTYQLTVQITDEVAANGFVKDFAELDLVVENWLRQVDHKVLNHIPGLEQNPTAEIVAAWFAEHLKNVWQMPVTVRVYENPDCWAEVTV